MYNIARKMVNVMVLLPNVGKYYVKWTIQSPRVIHRNAKWNVFQTQMELYIVVKVCNQVHNLCNSIETKLTLPIFWPSKMSSFFSSQVSLNTGVFSIAPDFLVTGTPLLCWLIINSWMVGYWSASKRHAPFVTISNI